PWFSSNGAPVLQRANSRLNTSSFLPRGSHGLVPGAWLQIFSSTRSPSVAVLPCSSQLWHSPFAGLRKEFPPVSAIARLPQPVAPGFTRDAANERLRLGSRTNPGDVGIGTITENTGADIDVVAATTQV